MCETPDNPQTIGEICGEWDTQDGNITLSSVEGDFYPQTSGWGSESVDVEANLTDSTLSLSIESSKYEGDLTLTKGTRCLNLAGTTWVGAVSSNKLIGDCFRDISQESENNYGGFVVFQRAQ